MTAVNNTHDTRKIEEMFDSIAHRYDLLNRVLSLGIDTRWRKRLRMLLDLKGGQTLLDLATGSGDILKQFLHGNSITAIGCDRSGAMLGFAQKKLVRKRLPALLVRGDAFRLPFRNETMDAVTIGFGIRNMRPRIDAMHEIRRVLKPGGKLAILEFFPRQRGLRGKAYVWYAGTVIPRIGRLISGSDFAYRYLPESIRGFPEIEEFQRELEDAGYTIAAVKPMTFGIVSIVVAEKC
jgi:demethylmenaquinone methyltransferase / 2-methoxy-6-polyprenyl-1,4-benzoquinol methylase